MKHLVLSIFLLLFFVEVFSVLPHRTDFTQKSRSPHFVSGLINVHTALSDGYKNIPELVELAKNAGHDFILFADQNTTEGRRLGFDKEFNGIDSFVEIETKTPSGNLLVFFSHTTGAELSDREIGKLGYEHFLNKNTRPGLFVSVSHPSHVKHPWTQLERFSDGIEIINFDSLFWRHLSDNPLNFAGISLLYPLNQFAAALRFIQPFPKDFLSWDNMNTLSSGHFGFLSSKSTRKLHLPFSDISWPSYEEIFRLGSNIIFLKSPLAKSHRERKEQIYEAIRESRLAMVFQALFPFEGNDFYLECPNSLFRVGDKAKLGKQKCELVVRTPENLPYKTKVRIFRDGELEKTVSSSPNVLRIPVTESGSYRAEILVRPHSAFWILVRKWVPYVLYNPILIQ